MSSPASDLTIKRPSGQEGRLPSLDGLRAISIALVLHVHAAGTQNFLPLHWRYELLGGMGVKIFFVISGFLITSLLLDELGAAGRISLRNFYARRCLRIFPAFWLYVGVVALAEVAGLLKLNHNDLIYAITYTMNHHPGASWYMLHLWSLAVEEQFYLLWPFVLFLLGRRRAFWGAAAMLIVAPAVRIIMWHRGQEDPDQWLPIFPAVADALATGCLLAGLRTWLHAESWYMKFLKSPAFVVVPAVLAAVFYFGPLHLLFLHAVGHTILNITVVLCMDRVVTLPRGPIGWFLNCRPMVFIGVLSYSLYLWQQPFLNRFSDSPVAAFPLNLCLVFLAALSSYFLVEKPLLKLRKRFRRESKPAMSTQP